LRILCAEWKRSREAPTDVHHRIAADYSLILRMQKGDAPRGVAGKMDDHHARHRLAAVNDLRQLDCPTRVRHQQTAQPEGEAAGRELAVRHLASHEGSFISVTYHFGTPGYLEGVQSTCMAVVCVRQEHALWAEPRCGFPEGLYQEASALRDACVNEVKIISLADQVCGNWKIDPSEESPGQLQA
jgi:hypothetical protein